MAAESRGVSPEGDRPAPSLSAPLLSASYLMAGIFDITHYDAGIFGMRSLVRLSMHNGRFSGLDSAVVELFDRRHSLPW